MLISMVNVKNHVNQAVFLSYQNTSLFGFGECEDYITEKRTEMPSLMNSPSNNIRGKLVKFRSGLSHFFH